MPSSNNLSNNLFAYTTSEGSGLSTPQDGLSANSSQSISTAATNIADEESYVGHRITVRVEREQLTNSQVKIDDDVRLNANKRRVIQRADDQYTSKIRKVGKGQQQQQQQEQPQKQENTLFNIANSVATIANMIKQPNQSPQQESASVGTPLQWGSKVQDFALDANGNSVIQAHSLENGNSLSNNQDLQTRAVAEAATAASIQQLSPLYPIAGSTTRHQHAKGTFTGKKFVCTYPNCHKTFSRKMNLKSHVQSTHEHKKPFQCSICMMSFARHSDRRRHERNQHKVSPGFVCGGVLKNGQRWGCGKVFKRKDGLLAHWRSQKARKKCLNGVPDDVHPLLSSARNGVIDHSEASN